MMKKKLFAIFGPVILAFILIAIFFTSSYRVNVADPEIIHRAASSMSDNVLRGDVIKNTAFAEKKYVPFLGSSELSRISPFHPSVLAQNYQRSYEPFLLGAPGTQSLSQFMMMRSASKDLRNKKVVVIVSPQWFVKDGVKEDYFSTHYSELQTLDWLFSIKKVTASDRYFARRLLSFSIVSKDEDITRILSTVQKGIKPNDKELAGLEDKWNILKREDELFSGIGLTDKQKQIDQATKPLPTSYEKEQLNKLATQIGASKTKNNPFALKDDFYNTRIKHHLAELKDSQKDWDYRFSKEYSDFQLLLQQLANEHTEALFILPPVNEKWSDYTGLSQEMLQGFAKKIKYQLKKQGFQHIADLTKMASVPYFMEDTIHLGWQGWLTADQYIQPFLEEKQPVSHYQMDDAFYSKDWQLQTPDTLPEK